MGENISSLIIGIDEAGRGPLIGDMILAAVVFDHVGLRKLEELRVRDSKDLSPHTRAQLYGPIIRSSTVVAVSHITPREIDSFNLNRLLLRRIVSLLKIISVLIDMNNVTSIIIDEIKGWQKFLPRKIRELAPKAKLVVEPRADSKYIIVSAASIVAKYIRDTNLEPVRRLLGDFGSGYPSDPKTREWIISEYKADMGKPPLIIRRTWSTLSSLAPNWFIKKQTRPNHKHVSQKSILDYISQKDQR
ncbi:MAG: ribonuclease HII [Crenarchaeota archaeon]|nr:ribonuclease HII [Thermoproteota archaeon]